MKTKTVRAFQWVVVVLVALVLLGLVVNNAQQHMNDSPREPDPSEQFGY